jgi:hypothetical protein
VFWVIDYLWPLWDDDNQRLTDKMFSTQVVLDDGRPEEHEKVDQGER